MNQLYTRWGRNLDAAHILQEYPRPTLMRDTYYENLNGYWEYAFTNNSHKPICYDGKILVPFSPESVLSGLSRQLQPDEYLWYRREITLKREKMQLENQHLILHFGAVDQKCKVWVNGRKVIDHIGGYLPFSCDITKHIHNGNNELLVMVQDLSDMSYHSRGKQKLKRGGMYYTAQSGIWKTVWLEAVPENWITRIDVRNIHNDKTENKPMNTGYDKTSKKVKIYIKTSERLKNFPVKIDIRSPKIYAGKDGNITDFASLSKKLPEVQKSFYGRTNTWVELEVPNAKNWSCEEPYLYYFHVSMLSAEQEDIVFDEVESYFAIRNIKIEKDGYGIPRIYFNDKKQFQKGVLDQGYWPEGLYTAPTDEAIIFDIQEMKRAGFNMVRKHIKIEPERWYYHCDRMGIIVWQDMVNGGEKYKSWFVTYLATIMSELGITVKDHHSWLLARRSRAGRNEFVNEVKETIQFLRNHPSICTWVIFNEAWGQFRTKKITEMVKNMDSERLIDSASGWFDQKCGDFQSIHNYFFPLKVRPEKHRVTVLSEFGGCCYAVRDHRASDKTYGYGICKSRKEYDRNCHELMRRVNGLEEEGLCACVYTQWTDIEDEINGIYTYDREKKKIINTF